jgi:multidrug efflux pump subunit AcrB
VAKNGILLLDADQRIRVTGASAEEAMLQASRRRLRPIVMTALQPWPACYPWHLLLVRGRRCSNRWPSP